MKSFRGQYVGVAATTTPKEVGRLRGMLDRMEYPVWPASTWFMNGPLVSRRTLMGEPPSNPAQYPSIDRIPDLMLNDTRFFNVIHFNSRDPRLCWQLTRIMEFVPQTQGIQLNIAWPEPDELWQFVRHHRHVYLILQVSRFAYQEAGGTPAGLVERLRKYEGLVDYVLFDPSGGEGIPFDRDQALSILEAEVGSGLDFGWGVTGGLAADQIQNLQELIWVYPELCWDAQSRMRSGDERDVLHLHNCSSFLRASARLIADPTCEW